MTGSQGFDRGVPMLKAWWAICLLILVSLTGCSRSGRIEVFAIERTGTFHRGGCPPVSMARTLLCTREEAVGRHLKPCPACRPDLL